jgi:hypothetical protein
VHAFSTTSQAETLPCDLRCGTGKDFNTEIAEAAEAFDGSLRELSVLRVQVSYYFIADNGMTW